MALKPCPQCGKMISDKAEKCPKCGLDIKNLYSAENSQGTQNINNPPINEKTALNNTSTHQPSNEGPFNQGVSSSINEPSYNEVSSYKENPKKSRTGLWICVCIILAVSMGAAIWIPIYKHNEKIKAEQLARIILHRRDSIAAVEAELARLEQMRLDSIKLEQYKQSIDNQFVTPKDIFTSYKKGWTDGVKKMLNAKGYELTDIRKFEEQWYDEGTFINTEWTYALESTNPEYKVWNKVRLFDQGDEGEICYIEFCDEEHLQSFIQQSLKLGLKKEKIGKNSFYRRDSGNYVDSWELYWDNNKSLTLRAGLTP